MVTLIPVEYRTWLNQQPPKRTKLEIGGWAGDNTWDTPQPWHCKSFSDAATYGLELTYPWEETCDVICDERGICSFSGNFLTERFTTFAPWFFGFVGSLDIKVPDDYALLVQPHPKVYVDRNGSYPIALPGLLDSGTFSVVFKAPKIGTKLTFKKDDPIASLIMVPKLIKYDLKEMSSEDKKIQSDKQLTLEQNWKQVCTRVFQCSVGNNSKAIGDTVKMLDKQIDCGSHKEPILDKDFWKDVPPLEEDEDLVEGDLGELEEIICKTDNFDQLSDDDMDKIIMAFKRQKRKLRRERSAKIKEQCQQLQNCRTKLKTKQNQDRILGHKVEKLL